MKQPETKFKEKVLAKLMVLKLQTKGKIWYLKTQEKATRGIPDILICAGGIFLAWELKVGKNKASGLQDFILQKINEAGGIAKVVTPENLDEAYMEVQCLCLLNLNRSSYEGK